MTNLRIHNIVCTTIIAENLNLERIHNMMKEVKYNSKTFLGLILRLKDLGTTLLIFKRGRVVSTGGKDVEDVNRSIRTLIKILGAANFEVNKNPKITIQNIVATYNLGVWLNLNDVAVRLGLENVEYEPEQFPGLMYRIDAPKTVLLLFQSGKIICTSAKQIEDMAINKLKDNLYIT
ncbi:MAG: TATA-box-binding protein [Thermoplasmata archaeon]|nr:MAG: TATA-box-binding protein [Thermoplasmata archaeon]